LSFEKEIGVWEVLEDSLPILPALFECLQFMCECTSSNIGQTINEGCALSLLYPYMDDS